MADIQKEEPKKVWNRNFFLMWQGSFVSALGDMVYQIAISAWVFAQTGSTAMMGSVVAVGFIPPILLSPFVGTYVDRHDRRKIMIITDFLRGIVIVGAGILALSGRLPVWAMYPIALYLGLTGVFFNPAVMSALPDLVPKNQVAKASSAISLSESITRVLGEFGGGFFMHYIGAPFLFLFNGISFLFSGFTEIFLKIPQVHHENRKKKFMNELKDGLLYVKNNKGLIIIMITGCFLNFFGTMGGILHIPFFETRADLGMARYGIFAGIGGVGSILGGILLSSINLKPEKRHTLFVWGLILSGFATAAIPYMPTFFLMVAAYVISCMVIIVVNIIFRTVLMTSVPSDKRGKVSGLITTLLTGLIPVGMALGGFLGEIIPYPVIMAGSGLMFSVLGFVILPFKNFKRFINQNFDQVETPSESSAETE